MYSFPNLEPVCCSMFGSNCCFLTCIQISQETGQVVWHSHLFKNFPQFVVIHTVKGFGVVDKAELDVFLEFFCFFYDPTDVGNLISGPSAFSKTSLNTWKFTVHILLKPGLENFEHYFTSVWDECNCAVVWAFFGIAFLWNWNENWPFPALWPRLSFPNVLAYWVQHFYSIIDLNQIPYDYTVEVRNRFKGLELIECLMNWGSWHCTGDRDQDHPHGKEMQKSKMAVWGGLTNSCVKKRSKKQRRKRKI